MTFNDNDIREIARQRLVTDRQLSRQRRYRSDREPDDQRASFTTVSYK